MIKKIKIGIVGCGTIGEQLAHFIEKRLKEKVLLFALSDKDIDKAQQLSEQLKSKPFIYDIDKIVNKVDFIIESASVEAANYLLKQAIKYKKSLMILSVGALVGAKKILQDAEKKGVKIYIPSGAICGVDGIGALSLDKIQKIVLVTSKPPSGFAQNKYLEKKGIDLANIKKPTLIFKGNVKDAIKFFPQNINVAATLLVASGFKNVEVYIKVDPKLKKNIHSIFVYSKSTKLNLTVENIPSKLNPKTSKLAVLSSQYLLKKIFSSVTVGS